MRILMFGRGVISAQYGWALEKARHEVEFYVRPGRKEQFGPFIDLDLLDGRTSLKGVPIKEQWPIRMIEELSPHHSYDLIVLSVNHNQFEDVVKVIGPNVGNATILIFNNVWKDLREFAEGLPMGQIIWGFPGAGGGFSSPNKLEGGFLKSIYLQTEATAASAPRHRSVVELFRQAGFSFSWQKDIRVWYWFHFIMNAGMAAEALKEGGYRNLYQSPKKVAKAIRLMREMLPMITAKGGKVGLGTSFAMRLPAGLIGYAAFKILKGNSVPAAIMERMERTGYISQESFAHFPNDILAEAHNLGVSLPRLEAMEQHFK
ncbi:ketopantoate reductase [Paenibacillus lycopersici]|uniref:Ketopantoate reductase n=1 Tax=Paenibacillus lycopersici TaxID=2704462 RepID=A0A6C0FNA1_9BACL|nr:2-dehydropantoate 2-reductase N-terminal domain-containing protein [Paenibacillus lycopersici]QHT58616.1 ketopantoate reductase [Paenibacillus lycopersici]